MVSADHLVLTRAHERLREELADDEISLEGDTHQVTQLLQELEHSRRPPLHESRTPLYGALVLPAGRSLIRNDQLIELIDIDLPLEDARSFADGRSTYLVRQSDGGLRLACFRRTMQYEADLVDIQAATGAGIVQRTLLGVARAFTSTGVVEWNGREWTMRPSARTFLPAVKAAVLEAPRRILEGILDLCVHWLSPSRIGATILLDLSPRYDDNHNLDFSASLISPRLSVATRHHYPALFAVLMQNDLATLVDPEGNVTHIGVGLNSSSEAEAAVILDEGMRHRSAARYTWDHHHTVAFVVSEGGPVTVFRSGVAVEMTSV